MLTANPAAEVSPNCDLAAQELKAHAQRGPGVLVAHLEGRGDRYRYPDKSREGRVPDSWRTSRQERAGTTKTKEPAGQEAEGAGK